MRGERRVTVVFFGDAGVEEGAFYESINFAALKRLPVIFVCENNLYSVYSHISVRQPKGREIFWLAKGHGIESYQGDGNDVIEVYQLAECAVRKARQGDGPTFLEFKTYRWREHCGPYYDNDLGYRTESEFQEWRRRCPIEGLEKRLLREGVLCNQDIDRKVHELKTEIEDAVVFAKNSPFPEEQALMEHIYAL
jgi:pyruvate dehydrogenase E1 component alpha subunit